MKIFSLASKLPGKLELIIEAESEILDRFQCFKVSKLCEKRISSSKFPPVSNTQTPEKKLH
jgi:hypothetical protein